MPIKDKLADVASVVAHGYLGTKAPVSHPSEGFNYGVEDSGYYWDREASRGIDPSVANQRLKPDLSPEKYVPSVGRADKHA